MNDSEILKGMMKGKVKEVRCPVRTAKTIEVTAGIFDDYVHPGAQQNVFYLKWIKLVQMHKFGEIELKGKFRFASEFIGYASQFDERYIPTNILLGAGTNEFSPKTVSFVAPNLYRAIMRKNIDAVEDYMALDGGWHLTEEERTCAVLRAS